MITSNLAQILYNKEVKLKEVCEQTGISKDLLSGLYHNNADFVTLHALEEICDYLDIPLSELMEYDPSEKQL